MLGRVVNSLQIFSNLFLKISYGTGINFIIFFINADTEIQVG